MSDWISSDVTRYCAMGTVEQTQNSRGTGIAPGGVNTKGNYGELIASSPFDADGMLIHLEGPFGVAGRALADIAIGSPGSEGIFLNNLHIDARIGNTVALFHFPVAIPAQSRIAARVQSSEGAQLVRIMGHLYGNGFASMSSFGKITTYGANTSDSGGVAVDPGATAGIKGSWAQITSNATSDISRLLIAVGADANISNFSASWLFDLGIGSAGNEIALLKDQALVHTYHMSPRVIGPLSVSIPAGSRISIRASCTTTNATNRLFDVVLYGVS